MTLWMMCPDWLQVRYQALESVTRGMCISIQCSSAFTYIALAVSKPQERKTQQVQVSTLVCVVEILTWQLEGCPGVGLSWPDNKGCDH